MSNLLRWWFAAESTLTEEVIKAEWIDKNGVVKAAKFIIIWLGGSASVCRTIGDSVDARTEMKLNDDITRWRESRQPRKPEYFDESK